MWVVLALVAFLFFDWWECIVKLSESQLDAVTE